MVSGFGLSFGGFGLSFDGLGFRIFGTPTRSVQPYSIIRRNQPTPYKPGVPDAGASTPLAYDLAISLRDQLQRKLD